MSPKLLLTAIIGLGLFFNYGQNISSGTDIRWENASTSITDTNKILVALLDTVFTEDQTYRRKLKEIEDKFGRSSIEYKNQWEIIKNKDAANLIKVTAILDEYGWLSQDIVGKKGNLTIFLVIQHSDRKTQEKYLPMMKNAVKYGHASASNLALLEDRVALGQGKKQIYGSQIGRNKITGKYYILPLEDPENVDKRRAEIGLAPLQEYVKQWKIIWSLEQYVIDIEENTPSELLKTLNKLRRPLPLRKAG
jgi:hypothetical protein